MSHWWSACRSTGTSWPGKFPRLVTQVTEGYNIWCDLLGFSIISKQKYQLTGLLGIHFRCWRFCISIMVPIRSNRDLMSHYWNYCRWWWLRIPEWGLTSLGSFLDRWISLISYDFIWAWNGAKTGDPWGPLNPLNIPERMVPLICWKALCPNWLNDSGGESNSIVIIFNGWMNNEDSFICTPRDHHQRQPFANNIFKKKKSKAAISISPVNLFRPRRCIKTTERTLAAPAPAEIKNFFSSSRNASMPYPCKPKISPRAEELEPVLL